MRNTINSVGTHIIGEFFGCKSKKLEYKKDVESILLGSVKEAKFASLHHYFYQFDPVGATGVVVLSQSHISIHTWPEYNYLAVDVFSCGTAKQAEKAFDYIVKSFSPKSFKKRVVVRGVAEAVATEECFPKKACVE